LYKGTTILKDENGNVATPNQTVKYEHGKVEWFNFLKSILNLGYGKFEVLSVIDHSGKEPKPESDEVVASIKAELDAVFTAPKVGETQEAKTIREQAEQISKQEVLLEGLSARLEALESSEGKTTITPEGVVVAPLTVVPPSTESDADAKLLAETQEKYTKITGKLPKNKTIAQLLEEIDIATPNK
jgi:predicted phage tail protein